MLSECGCRDILRERTVYMRIGIAAHHSVPDITISMGCNVGCPFIGRPFDDNWGLEDPTGKSDAEFKVVIEQIRHDILGLKGRLNQVAGAE